MAARALRQEHQAAARRDGRPARRALLRRPRARPGRARHHVDAGAAADDQHDGARPRTTRAAQSRPRRSTPTRSAATCSRSSPTGAPTGRSHPHASRDSLHEHDMWVAEGLTHRYPTKVLAELLSTCPQYCGHCTRMDLVGNSTPVIDKLKFDLKPVDRYDAMIDYLRRTPASATSSSPAATWPTCRGSNLESFVDAAARDRQHPRHPAGHQGADGPAAALAAGRRARGHGARRRPRRARGVTLAIHTHVNHAQSVTPLVAEATKAMLDAGVRDVRNQGVLMRGVNADPGAAARPVLRAARRRRRSCPTTSTCAT